MLYESPKPASSGELKAKTGLEYSGTCYSGILGRE